MYGHKTYERQLIIIVFIIAYGTTAHVEICPPQY
jgi:hypothetical protein